MRQLQEDLWQSTLHSSGILNTHAYFLRRPEGNVLFYNTGNNLWDGKWATLVLSDAGGSEAALAGSLLRLRDLDPNLVMSSGFVGDAALAEVADGEWPRVIDDNARRLTRKSSPAGPETA